MSKSNTSPAKIPAEAVAMQRTYSERMLLAVWLLAVFANGGCAMASQSVQSTDTHGTDLALFSNKAAVVQLTVSDHEARAPTDAFTIGATAYMHLLTDKAKLLTGHDTETDRREQDEFEAIQAFPTMRGMLLILPELVFRSRDSRLSSSASRALEPLLQFLIKHPDKPVEIDGFSDGLGSMQDNQILSQQRAETVKSTLVSRGATAAQISAYGCGSQAPVASDSDPVGRRRNRRIEIVIGSKDSQIPGWSDL
jgi:outer membrane protein OmpA-like peptidoglycan-associated protein